MMHKSCKYSFNSTAEKTKSTYSGLEQKTVYIDYVESCTKCGLNASAVVIQKHQPLCSSYESTKRRKTKC